MGLSTNPAGLLNQQPLQVPQNQQQTETSRQNPAKGDRIQRLEQMGLNQKMRENILYVTRELTNQWAEQIIQKQRETAKALEYSKGNQFVVLDPFTNNYYNPLQGGLGGADTFNAATLANLYQVSHNYIQFLDGVYVSILKASIPRVQYWPDDANSDLDNRTAQAKSRASRMIGRQNNESSLLEQALKAFFYGGSYWRYTRWSMDERICKPTFIDKEEMQEKTVMPDRYECPSCGADTPTQPGMQPPPCQQCGQPLSSANFQQAVKMQMPVVVGKQEVPSGQVRMSIYNCMSIIQLPQTPADGSPVMNTPLLRLSAEIFPGALRGMYPDAWDLAKAGSSDSNRDGEAARMLRIRMSSPSWSRGQLAGNKLPTYYRDWLQPDAFDFLDKQSDAQLLHDKFPKGVCIASLGNDMLDARPAEMHKEWTWAGTRTDVGAYPPARVQPAMPIQDQINDEENTITEFNDRAACGPILYNNKLVGEQLNNQHMKPGILKGITVKSGNEPGFKLENVFYQFQAKIDAGIYKHRDALAATIQLLCRITPQTWGGSTEDIQTKGGQEQALKVAMGVLWGDWDQLRQEFASAADVSTDCLTLNATQDMHDVIQGEDSPGFKNDSILLADLNAGGSTAYPEADQGYPIGYEQQRQLYLQMIGMADGKVPNPLVMEILDSYKNRRLALRYVGPPDSVLPEEAARNKVLTDISKLVEDGAQPMPGTDPVTQAPVELPSIMPDADFLKDFWDVAIEAAVEYGLNNAKLIDTNPQQFENLRLYLKQCRYLQKVSQAQAALPPGGLPQGGPGDAGGAPGGAAPPPPGAVAPPPVPPSPNGPQPMPAHQ